MPQFLRRPLKVSWHNLATDGHPPRTRRAGGPLGRGSRGGGTAQNGHRAIFFRQTGAKSPWVCLLPRRDLRNLSPASKGLGPSCQRGVYRFRRRASTLRPWSSPNIAILRKKSIVKPKGIVQCDFYFYAYSVRLRTQRMVVTSTKILPCDKHQAKLCHPPSLRFVFWAAIPIGECHSSIRIKNDTRKTWTKRKDRVRDDKKLGKTATGLVPPPTSLTSKQPGVPP